MTMLALLDDCVCRARRVPVLLAGFSNCEPDAGREFCDTLLADLDLALQHCVVAISWGEEVDLVVSQILQLKWLVYCALTHHLAGLGWSDTALAAMRYSATCDLRDSQERLEAARHAPHFARAG